MTQTNTALPSRWSDWKTLEYLGGGSFGAVYKIQRTISGTNEYAAVKIIPVPKEPAEGRNLLDSGYDLYSINQRYREDLEAIQQEYVLMANLKGNANVVYCDDICEEPNPDGIGWTLYIRMELLTPLMKALVAPYGEAQVVKLGMDLCNALAACKRKAIIHRDIKPSNIMVSEDGNYKLGDFGVAKKMEGTSGGTKTGTYDFMAPEVYNNRPYGQSADIYSLGMVLYWMLNLRCGPFLPLPPTVPNASQAENARDRRFGGEELPPPANGGQALKKIVLRACAFDPASRYSDPEAFCADLAQYAQSRRDDPAYCEPFPVIPPINRRSQDIIWDDDPSGTMGGGTISGGTISGDSDEHLGQLDVRCELKVTAQELATGCVKRVAINNVLGNVVMEAAMKAQAGSAASAYARAAAKMVDITIPAGTKAGTVLRLTGAGRVDTATGAAGDAYVTVIIDDSGSPNVFWKQSSKQEENSACSGVISSTFAKYGCSQTFSFKDGKSKTVRIPAGCKDGQVVDGVKIYVHDFSIKTPNMEQLPDAVLEMYASQTSGIVIGIVFAFLLWMIFGMVTMMIPVMAVGLFIHILIAVAYSIKKKKTIDHAAYILKRRKK